MYLTIFNHLNYPLNMKTSAIISDFNTCDDHQAYPFYCTLPYISFQIYIQVTNLVSYWDTDNLVSISQIVETKHQFCLRIQLE